MKKKKKIKKNMYKTQKQKNLFHDSVELDDYVRQRKLYDIDIEKIILGLCLMEKEALQRTYKLIEPNDFYYEAHGEIYNCLLEMFEKGLPIDIATTFDYISRIKGINHLKNRPNENIPYFLTTITNSVYSSAHLEYYCTILKALYIERELLKITTSGFTVLPEGGEDFDVIKKINLLEEKLSNLKQINLADDITDMTTLMFNLYKHQDKMAISNGIGLETGIYGLDKQNGGFHGGELIVLGARPSIGKSAFVGKLAINIAQKGVPVGIISLEMNNNEIAGRLASIDADIDFKSTYRGLFKDEQDRQKMYEIINNRTANYPIYITDKSNVDINDIRVKTERMKRKYGVKCLIIDYLQLIETPYIYNRNRENAISELSRKCKIMAKEMDMPVIILCQLNREVTKRKGKERYPQLSDLRESGSIEQDADIVMFLHRDFMIGIETNENGETTEFEADLVIRKWRNGNSNFIIKLDFDPQKMKFTERKGEIFTITSYIPNNNIDEKTF